MRMAQPTVDPRIMGSGLGLGRTHKTSDGISFWQSQVNVTEMLREKLFASPRTSPRGGEPSRMELSSRLKSGQPIYETNRPMTARPAPTYRSRLASQHVSAKRDLAVQSARYQKEEAWYHHTHLVNERLVMNERKREQLSGARDERKLASNLQDQVAEATALTRDVDRLRVAEK